MLVAYFWYNFVPAGIIFPPLDNANKKTSLPPRFGLSVPFISTNIAVGKDEPSVYFSKVWNQLINQNYVIGNLKTEDAIKKNLDDNCIPVEIKNWTFENYEEFLLQRRKLMAAKIKEYYEKL